MYSNQTSAVTAYPLHRLWSLSVIRAFLLGTTDQGSVLLRLPKSEDIMCIILSLVVLDYQCKVPSPVMPMHSPLKLCVQGQ